MWHFMTGMTRLLSINLHTSYRVDLLFNCSQSEYIETLTAWRRFSSSILAILRQLLIMRSNLATHIHNHDPRTTLPEESVVESHTVKQIRIAFEQTPIRLRIAEQGWKERRRACIESAGRRGRQKDRELDERDTGRLELKMGELPRPTFKCDVRQRGRDAHGRHPGRLDSKRGGSPLPIPIRCKQDAAPPTLPGSAYPTRPDARAKSQQRHESNPPRPIPSRTQQVTAPPTPPPTPPNLKYPTRSRVLSELQEKHDGNPPRSIIAFPLPATSAPIPLGRDIYLSVPCPTSQLPHELVLQTASGRISVLKGGEVLELQSNPSRTRRTLLRLQEHNRWSKTDGEQWYMVWQLMERLKRRTPRVGSILERGP